MDERDRSRWEVEKHQHVIVGVRVGVISMVLPNGKEPCGSADE
jgi:hypothetical protein